MNLEQRTAALLAVVADARRERCAQLLAPARAQAQALVASALREARRRVRTAIDEERKRLALTQAAAAAQLATEQRLAQQRLAAERLRQGWEVLRAALAARWHDAAARRGWIDAHLARLPRPQAEVTGAWTLTGPADWPAAESEALAQALRARGAPAVRVVAEAQLGAGFRVQAGNNVLDATIDGLLADRAAVQGRLLQLIEEAP